MFKLKYFILGVVFFNVFSLSAIDLKNTAMFGLGFASGTVFHEIGHASLILAQGGTVTSMGFQYTKGKFYSDFNRKNKVASLGGYLSQSLATEIIFQNKNWHQNDYALGWMSLGIFVNLSNPIRYYIFKQKHSDLGIYEQAGGNPLIPAILMVMHSGFTLYRVFSDTDIPFYLGKNTVGFSFKF